MSVLVLKIIEDGNFLSQNKNIHSCDHVRGDANLQSKGAT